MNKVSPTAEAEFTTLFMIGKQWISLCQALIKPGYSQLPTTLITGNENAANLCNDNLKQNQSKSIDIRFY